MTTGESRTLVADLPADWRNATLVGRILTRAGPTVVVVTAGRVRDVSRVAPTVSQLLDGWSDSIPAGEDLGPLDALPIGRAFDGATELSLLSPFDLQCVKASGVTFASPPSNA